MKTCKQFITKKPCSRALSKWIRSTELIPCTDPEQTGNHKETKRTRKDSAPSVPPSTPSSSQIKPDPPAPNQIINANPDTEFVEPKYSARKSKGNKSTKTQRKNKLSADFIRTYSPRLQAYLTVTDGDNCLQYDQFVEMLVSWSENQNSEEIRNQYTDIVEDLIIFLRFISVYIDDRSLKISITRLANNLDDPNKASDTDSVSSQKSNKSTK